MEATPGSYNQQRVPCIASKYGDSHFLVNVMIKVICFLSPLLPASTRKRGEPEDISQSVPLLPEEGLGEEGV